jgi:hypothetical protein
MHKNARISNYSNHAEYGKPDEWESFLIGFFEPNFLKFWYNLETYQRYPGDKPTIRREDA